MSAVRQRKLKDAEGITNGAKKITRKQKPPGKLQRIFVFTTLITVTVVLGLYTSILHPVVERVADTLGYTETIHAVIIDAGSTGSRVLAYTFYKTFVGSHLILRDELFHEIKPGLSAYVENPDQGARSILTLLEQAYAVVPKEKRSSSPLLLRATAGLRLLDPTAAERLLEEVRAALRGSGFKVGPDSVEIMDGQDEGINSWFTVNFLKGRLNHVTKAALDLGGGSTQVTYEPRSEDAPKPLVSVPSSQRNISLYTYSYLNLGLMAARRGIFLSENAENATHLFSECINPVIKSQPWRYANVDYLVSGPQKDIKYRVVKETQSSVSDRVPVVRLDRCKAIVYRLVRRLLESAPIPTHLEDQDVNAFSYYYDRASEAGLIDPINGGKVKVKDFIGASESECASPNVDQPWACVDLTFISILLQEAFHLEPQKELELVKKINGHEISWALGLAYNTLARNL